MLQERRLCVIIAIVYAHYSGRKRRDMGSVFCSTSSSTTGKHGFLNNVVGVFEYEVDENGNSGGKIWEWK
jgi:hypothetical protein